MEGLGITELSGIVPIEEVVAAWERTALIDRAAALSEHHWCGENADLRLQLRYNEPVPREPSSTAECQGNVKSSY